MGHDHPPAAAPNLTDVQAVRDFPELSWLIALRDAGWHFLTPHVDETGCPFQVEGVRPWQDGWADAIRVRSPTDTLGLRLAPGVPGGVTWQRAGTLAEVCGELLALPAPCQSAAPRLVHGSAPAFRPPC